MKHVLPLLFLISFLWACGQNSIVPQISPQMLSEQPLDHSDTIFLDQQPEWAQIEWDTVGWEYWKITKLSKGYFVSVYHDGVLIQIWCPEEPWPESQAHYTHLMYGNEAWEGELLTFVMSTGRENPKTVWNIYLRTPEDPDPLYD